MFTALSTALSALDATSTAIDVVGNNLANLNTTGYKDTTVSFQDLLSQSQDGGLGNTQVGMGVAPPITITQFTQGAIASSTGPLDSAIQGDGFFVVQNPSTNDTLYTRDGTFQVDASGNLLTATGQAVQGWNETGGQINTNTAIGNIQIPVGEIRQPVATTDVSVNMNLDAAATAGAADGTFSTPIQAVDSLGNQVTMTLTMTKDATNPLQWDYQITVPGNTTTGGTPGTPTNLLATPGTLTFDANGQLLTPSAANGVVPVSVTGLSDNAADMNINFNLYDANGSPTITQVSQPSGVSANSSNGQTSAELLSVSMGSGGQVLAQYSDGTQSVVAQLALASIRNPDSLTAVGDNDFQATAQTAQPAVGTANTGGRGQILGGSLEASTVDIASEFTNLIVLQRAYEANGKVITTMNQLSQDTINLTQQ
jgi:flagellar hook protein FlgE